MRLSPLFREWQLSCNQKTRGGGLLPTALLVKLFITALPASAITAPGPNFADLSFDELANIQITSVSKKAERLAGAPASVFVITNEDIRRSGASSLPEALRLAPNLQIARVDARNYAITARGFNSVFENKLLVLIDGRTVYSPFFSGVFWDAQDVVLEDIERIEVISGAGATLWGANAVNGVINIITRSAKDTQGSLLAAGASEHESNGALRYGGKLENGAYYRVYGKFADNDNTRNQSGGLIQDGWRRTQAGFRSDWSDGDKTLMLEANAYQAGLHERPIRDIKLAGLNLLGRATKKLADGSDMSLQIYLDHTERDQPVAYVDRLNTFDIEFQHALLLGSSHNLVWGGGYRYAMDKVQQNGATFAFFPESLNMRWSNLFVQDEISLHQNLRLTAGLKFEHSHYTGAEYLPSVRLAWDAAPNHLIWGSISRAIRSPSRIDRDIYVLPKPIMVNGVPRFFIAGGPNFMSEVAIDKELGYRGQLSPTLTYSVTAFHTAYDKLRTLEPGAGGLDAVFSNMAEATSRGVEMWGTWQALPAWRVSAGLSSQKLRVKLKPGSADTSGTTGLANNDASHFWMLRSSFDISSTQEIDLSLRHVGALPKPAVPAYTSLDLRYGWKIRPNLEFSIIGQNLLNAAHPESGPPLTRSEFERSLMVRTIWHF
ncbi:MAG: TonB-dependent receptor [Pseudomonadota bacterium]